MSGSASRPTLTPMSKRVIIVGAGLAGCLLAVYLARAGWNVDLRERRGDPRDRGQVAGRSINLAISARGLKALRRAGLEDVILQHAIRMPGRMIHSRAGALAFQNYSSDPTHAIQSVSRSALNGRVAGDYDFPPEMFASRRSTRQRFVHRRQHFATKFSHCRPDRGCRWCLQRAAGNHAEK